MLGRPSALLLAALLLAAPVVAQPATPPAAEPVDQAALETILRIGLQQSEVMEHARWLTDVNGPRLTGSPGLDSSAVWAARQFERWGLTAEFEPWGPFGRGWSLQRFSLHADATGPGAAPHSFPVHAVPRAWSPGVGTVTGEAVLFDAESEADFERFRGRLAGKVVLLETDVKALEEPFDGFARRKTDEQLLTLANSAAPSAGGRNYSEDAMRRYFLRLAKVSFLYGERPLAVLERSRGGQYGTIFTEAAALPAPAGMSWGDRPDPWGAGAEVIPQVVVAAEPYNRLLRLLEAGRAVTVALELEATYHDDDPMEFNVLAEIPGTDPALKDEVVVLGAHLDSWHGATGATDNAAGSAAVMEAARILSETFRALGTSPRRTIRFALWTGEEQGLYGSYAHVNARYGTVSGYGQPASAVTPEQERVSAYYNLDNGTGRIRGVYLQGNEAVRPVFRAWLAPLDSLGATTLTVSNTGGTDHLAFDAVGIPGFQFIQDDVAYSATHHGTFDSFDHLVEDDLRQAATIMAHFAYHTAQRDERLPRKPLVLATPEAVGTH